MLLRSAVLFSFLPLLLLLQLLGRPVLVPLGLLLGLLLPFRCGRRLLLLPPLLLRLLLGPELVDLAVATAASSGFAGCCIGR